MESPSARSLQLPCHGWRASLVLSLVCWLRDKARPGVLEENRRNEAASILEQEKRGQACCEVGFRRACSERNQEATGNMDVVDDPLPAAATLVDRIGDFSSDLSGLFKNPRLMAQLSNVILIVISPAEFPLGPAQLEISSARCWPDDAGGCNQVGGNASFNISYDAEAEEAALGRPVPPCRDRVCLPENPRRPTRSRHGGTARYRATESASEPPECSD
ncbi:hypothetical protein DFH06DRAFT_1121636 [Mycena polygramma]|nr:hypothetical protein DFH06DRAFT_1121636 [Mycena polygramma]